MLSFLIVVTAIPNIESVEVPLRINVVSAPPTLPSDQGIYESVTVWLSSADRLPIIADRDITIFLTSSNLTVGKLENSVVIARGRIMAVAKFTTTSTKGSTTITASSQGYVTGSTTVRTAPKSSTVGRLAIFASPPAAPSSISQVDSLFVSLLGHDGNPATSSSDISVILSSNSSIIRPSPSVTIPAGSLFIRASLRAGPSAGTANITAQADGVATASTVVRTFNFRANAMLAADPPSLKLGEKTKITLRASSAGGPLFGANVVWKTTLGKISPATNQTDPQGMATVEFALESAGNATISAYVTAQGYEPRNVSVTIRAILIALKVQVISPKVLNVSQQAQIQAIVTGDGRPAADAKVEWSSDIGVFEPSSGNTDNRGIIITNYTPDRNGTATITASVSKFGASSTKQSAQITVGPASPQAQAAQSQSTSTLPSILPFIVIPIPLIAILVIIVIRKRRKKKEEITGDEELVE